MHDIPVDGGTFAQQRMRKKNRTNFYWVMLLMHTIWDYWNFCGTWYKSNICGNSSNFFLFWFWYKCIKISNWKYLKQYVMIPHVLLKSLNQNENQYHPNQTCLYLLITTNEKKKHFVLKLIYFNSGQLQIRKRAITR